MAPESSELNAPPTTITEALRRRAARTVVTIETYNERDNVPPLVAAIFGVFPELNIVIVDDNSPDGTGKLADDLAGRDPRIKVVHRPGKQGLGTATLAALRFAIENGYEFALNMDADFSHQPKYLPALLAGMEANDVMIGSRYVAGGGAVGWDWKRKIMSWAINTYSRLTLGITQRDCSGAFRCYRLDKIKAIDFDAVLSRGYSFQEEFLYHCKCVGCRVGETPILFENRRAGQSKINSREAFKALWILFKVGLHRAGGRSRSNGQPKHQ